MAGVMTGEMGMFADMGMVPEFRLKKKMKCRMEMEMLLKEMTLLTMYV